MTAPTRQVRRVIIQPIPHEGRDNHLSGAAEGCARFLPGLDSVEDYSLLFDRSLPPFEVRPPLVPERTMPDRQIRDCAASLYQESARTLFLGGDHGISYGLIDAALERWPDLVVLQFDAHLDRRERHQGECISHATVFHRLESEHPDRFFFAFGVRSRGGMEEIPDPDRIFYGGEICRPLKELLEGIPKAPIYLTLDIDVLDPALFPAVSNPEPGGASWQEMLSALQLLSGRMVSADLNEYVPTAVHNAPAYDCVAGALLKELLIALAI